MTTPRCVHCPRDATHGVFYLPYDGRWHTAMLGKPYAAKHGLTTPTYCAWHAIVEAHMRQYTMKTREA